MNVGRWYHCDGRPGALQQPATIAPCSGFKRYYSLAPVAAAIGSREQTKVSLRNAVVCCCVLLLAFAAQLSAQEAPKSDRPLPPLQRPLPAPAPAPPPEPVPAGEVDGALSLEISYGYAQGHPSLRGHPTTTGVSPNLNYPGNKEQVPGATVSIPAGRYNNVRFSYFRTRGGGETAASQDLNLFGTSYSNGDLLVANYKFQHVKVSYDYLSYPAPPRGAHFRLKTLWEVQYVNFKTNIDVRNKLDSSGNPTFNPVSGSRWFIYPTLGAGVEHHISENFRWEAKASGFAIPHHADIWDAEAWIAYRVGKIEPRVGVVGFHFKTSPKKDQYIGGTTFTGVYVTLRWYPKL